MSPRLRKLFFYLSLLAFLIVGSYLVLLAEGLTFDTANLRIVPTGALFIETTPHNATLLVDGREEPRGTNILSSGTFVDRLAPGTHWVTVTRGGSTTWTKQLTVSSSRVTAASRITLWPTAPPRTILARNLRAFWVTGAGIVTQDASGTLRLGEHALRGTNVRAYDQGSSRIVTSAGGTFFLTDLTDLTTATNLSELFLSLRRQLVDVPLPPSVPARTSASAPPPEHVIDVVLHPVRGAKLLLATDSGIYELDTRKVSLERLAEVERFTALAKGGTDAFILDGSSTLTAVNLILRTSVTYAFPVADGIHTFIASGDGRAVAAITHGGSLLLFDRTAETLTSVAPGVSQVQFAPDAPAVTFLTRENRLGTHYFDNAAGDELHATGETLISTKPLPLPPGGTIGWALSFPGTLLIHASLPAGQAGGTLLAADTDLRPPLQVTVLATNVRAYSIEGTKLYLLAEDGTLSVTDLRP